MAANGVAGSQFAEFGRQLMTAGLGNWTPWRKPATRRWHSGTWRIATEADAIRRSCAAANNPRMAKALDLIELEADLGRLPASVHRVKGFVTDIATGGRCVAARRSIEQCPTSVEEPPPALVAIGTDRKDLEAVRLQLATLGAAAEVGDR